jgi:hypothetical protein
MDFNFSRTRLILLAAFLIIFFLIGGFSAPVVDPESYLDPRRIRKAWMYCVILYTLGAGCASVVDHYVGTIDRSNLRILYIILGVLVMLGSSFYIHSIKSGAAAPAEVSG